MLLLSVQFECLTCRFVCCVFSGFRSSHQGSRCFCLTISQHVALAGVFTEGVGDASTAGAHVRGGAGPGVAPPAAQPPGRGAARLPKPRLRAGISQVPPHASPDCGRVQQVRVTGNSVVWSDLWIEAGATLTDCCLQRTRTHVPGQLWSCSFMRACVRVF